MAKKTVRDLDVKGKKVLVRVDFNVPHKGDVITDDNRIVAALPTIKYLLENGAKVILFSHLGKVDHKDPEKKASDMAKNNMAPVAAKLQEYLPNAKVTFVNATRGAELEEAVNNLEEGNVVLGDEVLTPDSSRFWDKEKYEPGRSQLSFDKQFARDWLKSDANTAEPEDWELPQDIVDKTIDKYLSAYKMLTGEDL